MQFFHEIFKKFFEISRGKFLFLLLFFIHTDLRYSNFAEYLFLNFPLFLPDFLPRGHNRKRVEIRELTYGHNDC